MRQRIVAQKMAALGARPEFWLVCLLAWLFLSACRSLSSPWAGAALSEALHWAVGIGLTLTLSLTLHRVGTAARILALLAGAMALMGIWDGFRPEHGGVVGPYQDHQLYGSALLVLLPTAAALALTGRDIRWRIGGQAIAAAVVVCLLLSQTRSAWAGLAASALIFGGLWLKQSRGPQSRPVTAAACTAALLLGAMSVWAVTAQNDLQAPLASRVSTLSRLSTDQSWQARLAAWHGAAQMTAASPLTGCGLGRYPGAQWAWTHQGRPLSPTLRPSLSEEAHSFYLQTAAETGLIGLALYGAVLTAFAARGICSLRRKHGSRPGSRDALVIAALSMVAGQSVDALASPSWQFAEVSLLFWASLGVGLAAMRRAEPERVAVPVPRPLRRAGQFALSGAAAVLLAAQILPVGLLSPVEAYTPPAGWTLVANSTVLQGSTSTASVGDTVTYTLTAQYKDSSGAFHTVNVSNDSTATYVAFLTSNVSTVYGTFTQNSGAGNVSYLVPSGAHGQNLTIKGSFKSSGLNVTATTPLIINP